LGIVRFALRLPHTFYVVAALILFLGVTAAIEMPTDIFPEINIPVVSVIWQYTSLQPFDGRGRDLFLHSSEPRAPAPEDKK